MYNNINNKRQQQEQKLKPPGPLEGSAKQHFNRVADKNGNNCFICLHQGHSKGRCTNTKLIAEFQKFKVINHTVQRHSDSKSRWTDMVTTSDQGSCISHTQRKFVRPNLRMVLTDFMLNNSDGAAAQQHYWDGIAELNHRMRFDVKTIYSTEVPKFGHLSLFFARFNTKLAAKFRCSTGATKRPELRQCTSPTALSCTVPWCPLGSRRFRPTNTNEAGSCLLCHKIEGRCI
ncbi:hypothetical protein niasHT_028886 [Heterodera trifolii]|uniref:Uncharacterized protein n=1 Tax=Heterodera trifolii TaxID=157864 RepID=A0ABD2KIU7_9BILA